MRLVAFIVALFISISSSAQTTGLRATAVDATATADAIAKIEDIPAAVATTIAKDFDWYSLTNRCWVKGVDDEPWCFKLALHERRVLPAGEGHFVMLAGAPIDDSGERSRGCQACDGLVAAYLIDSKTGQAVIRGVDLNAGIAGAGAESWEVVPFGSGYAFATKEDPGEATEGLYRCSQGYCRSAHYIVAKVYDGFEVVLAGEPSTEHGADPFKCDPPEDRRKYTISDEIVNGYPVINVVESTKGDCEKIARTVNSVRLIFNTSILRYPTYPSY